MQSPIVKVNSFPDYADTLIVDSIYLPSYDSGLPSYRWALAKKVVTPGAAAQGVEGEDGYVPAAPDQVSYEPRGSDNLSLDQEQYDLWTTQPNSIFLTFAAESLGLTLA